MPRNRETITIRSDDQTWPPVRCTSRSPTTMPIAVPVTRKIALRTCSPEFVVAMNARNVASTAQ